MQKKIAEYIKHQFMKKIRWEINWEYHYPETHLRVTDKRQDATDRRIWNTTGYAGGIYSIKSDGGMVFTGMWYITIEVYKKHMRFIWYFIDKPVSVSYTHLNGQRR